MLNFKPLLDKRCKYKVTTSVSGDQCVIKVQNQSVLQHVFRLVATISIVFLLLAGASVEGAGQIAQRGTATSATTTNTTLTIAKPVGLSVGDVMIANIVQSDNDNNTLSNPTLANWILIDGRKIGETGGGGSNQEWWGSLLYKVATATDVAATNFSFALDDDANGDGSVGAIVAFSGVDVSGGIFDAAPGTINISGNISGVTASAITTTNANAAVIMFSMLGDNRNHSNWTTTSPGNLVELYDVPFKTALDNGIGAAWAIKPTAGATGDGTATLSGNARNGGILIALKPFISITPPSCTAPVSPVNNSISFPVDGSLTWNAVAGATGYRLYLGTDVLATNILNGIDLGNITSYNPPADLSFLTTYYWKIVPYNSIGEATGCSIWEFTSEDINYCSASSTIPAEYETITNVTFAGINNSSPVNKTIGYTDYTNTVNPATIIAGQNYSISVTETFQTGSYSGYCKVYIDYNHNGTFETPAELTFGFAYTGNATMTGTVSVPLSATIGMTRMRVVLEGDANSSGALPCGTFQWGEVEDYSVNILQPCSNATLTLDTGNSNQSVCLNSSITNILYSVGGSATGATVSGLPTGINGTFNNGTITISGTPTEIGIFNYTVTTTGTPSGCAEATASGTITVNPLPTANISDNNSPLCAGDDAVFNLTGTAGAILTYKVNSGSEQTIALTGGVATLTINNIKDDQVLTLISVTNGTCSQILNATATITVNPLPEIGSFY